MLIKDGLGSTKRRTWWRWGRVENSSVEVGEI